MRTGNRAFLESGKSPTKVPSRKVIEKWVEATVEGCKGVGDHHRFLHVETLLTGSVIFHKVEVDSALDMIRGETHEEDDGHNYDHPDGFSTNSFFLMHGILQELV